jgi:molybdenum cofactor cytidylyltransferase
MVWARSFCGVILAAGESTRMGSDKALLPWPPSTAGAAAGGQSLLSSAIQSLNRLTDMVIVVAGQNEPNLAPVVYANGAFLVRNPQPERGQFSSLQVGLQEVLNHGRDAAVVTLVDRPPPKSETLEALRAAFSSAPVSTWAIIPEFKGKHGHPIVLGRELIEVFLRSPGTSTARDIEHENQKHIQYFPVDDPLVTLNLNTPQEYAAILSACLAPQP